MSRVEALACKPRIDSSFGFDSFRGSERGPSGTPQHGQQQPVCHLGARTPSAASPTSLDAPPRAHSGEPTGPGRCRSRFREGHKVRAVSHGPWPGVREEVDASPKQTLMICGQESLRLRISLYTAGNCSGTMRPSQCIDLFSGLLYR